MPLPFGCFMVFSFISVLVDCYAGKADGLLLGRLDAGLMRTQQHSLLQTADHRLYRYATVSLLPNPPVQNHHRQIHAASECDRANRL